MDINKRFMAIKRHALALVVCCAFVLLALPGLAFAFGETGGSCGDAVTWDLQAGVLTIEGTGEMEDFIDGTFAPWYASRAEITSVSVASGITSIGDLAFYQLENITVVTLPSTVTRVGDYSFMECTALTTIALGDGVVSIGEQAFYACESLRSITFPTGLTSIGAQAFYRCASLSNVVVPTTVQSVGNGVFAYCTSLAIAQFLPEVDTLPSWTFGGCAALQTLTISSSIETFGSNSLYGCNSVKIYHTGSTEVQNSYIEQLQQDDESFGVQNFSSSLQAPTTVTTTTPDGYYTVQETENSAVDITQGYDDETTVVITYENDQGLAEVLELLETELPTAQEGETLAQPQVTLYLGQGETLKKEILEVLIEKNAILTVYQDTPGYWQFDLSQSQEVTLKDEYTLGYTAVFDYSYTTEQRALIDGCDVYSIYFADDIDLPFTLAMYLASGLEKQTASLYYFQGEIVIEFVQKIIMDNSGYALFYLGDVTSQKEYFAVINLGDGVDAVIPETILDEYGGDLEYTAPVEYEVTGASSSWGITIEEFTWLVAGGMVFVVLVVGIIMGTLNYLKIKKSNAQAFSAASNQ